ncbi:hypothetical protein [Streptomyces canus]|uniref:hypothetical protein n=1 Tax=Streptomyces canus TaxID=58343 RepID=UPI0032505EE4
MLLEDDDVFQDDGSQRNLAGERGHERVLRDHGLQIADSVTQSGRSWLVVAIRCWTSADRS